MNEEAARVIIAEPNPHIRDAVSQTIGADGYLVTVAATAASARVALTSTNFDLVLLSASLMQEPALGVADLRQSGIQAPIVAITVRSSTDSRISVLEAGADDIVNLPFAAEELRARIRALLRGAKRSGLSDHQVQYADVVLNLRTLTAFRSGRNLHLTRTERDLLRVFLIQPERALRRAELFEAVWGHDLEKSSNSLGLYVSYLRRKLELAGEPRLLWTVRGVGYVLRAD